MRRFISLSPEAQSAATWQAQRGLDGSIGSPLPNLMSRVTCDEINAKPALFKLAVHMAKLGKNI